MRCLSLLFLSLLCAACMSDMAVEEDPADTMYPSTASTPPPPRTDTLAAPVSADPEAAPTPYGMVIDPERKDLQAKGGSAALVTQQLLTGTWVNSSDPDESVAFTPTHYKTYYEGDLVVEEDMTFHQQCPGACSGGTSTDAPCFTVSGPAQTDCYGIVRLTDDILELQVLGVSTETVVYRRAD